MNSLTILPQEEPVSALHVGLFIGHPVALSEFPCVALPERKEGIGRMKQNYAKSQNIGPHICFS